MRRSFFMTALALCGLLTLLSSPTLAQTNIAEWTYMTYYNGDNNLESSIYGDLTEMQEVGSTDKVNIVAQVDRAPGYTTAFGDWEDTRRFLLQHEPQPRSARRKLRPSCARIRRRRQLHLPKPGARLRWPSGLDLCGRQARPSF